jgi:hypothetical protein
MLFPYYIAVDSTPNCDVSKRSKKSKQNARSKWDAPGCRQSYLASSSLLASSSFMSFLVLPILFLCSRWLEKILFAINVKAKNSSASSSSSSSRRLSSVYRAAAACLCSPHGSGAGCTVASTLFCLRFRSLIVNSPSLAQHLRSVDSKSMIRVV